MASLLVKRRQGVALQHLMLEMTAHHAVFQKAGFMTPDGEMVSYTAGLAAVHSGAAMLVGGLLVGVVLFED